MSDQTQKMDVLALIDYADDDLQRSMHYDASHKLREARAAVAELIDAATSAKNALAIIASSEESDVSDMDYRLLFEDLPRLRAALAHFGAAS